MRRWGLPQLLLMLAVCAVVWAIVAAGCLMFGSTDIGWPSGQTMSLRLQWTLIASIVGATLAAAGVAYQAVLRNPLAEPYLLGVSSGASLAVYFWASSGLTLLATTVGQQGFAFGGALITLAIVFALAQDRGRLEPVRLLLVGVIVNSVNAAIFLLAFYLGRSQDIKAAFRFLAGGLQLDLTIPQIATVAVCFAAGWIILFYLSGQLQAGTLSEAEAETLGVRIQRLRWIAMIVASLMTASAMAISGPIGFVGLVCPHVGRLLVKNDQRRLLPVATVLGACLLAIADAGSRRLGQLPVGVITGFIGGPFFLVLLWRNRRVLEGSR